MASQSNSGASKVPATLAPGDKTPAEHTSGALPAVRLMQWVGEDEAAVDFSVLWASAVIPVAALVDWRMIGVVLVPIVIRLAQRRLALRRLMQNGISPRSVQEALQWVENHQEGPPLPMVGALRAKAHCAWRGWICRHYVAPFVESDVYQQLAEREVELMARARRRR